LIKQLPVKADTGGDQKKNA